MRITNKILMAITIFSMALPIRVQCASERVHPGIDIPYRKFVLKNGLTLIVHEDHKTPIIAVNVWYHVGSKDEKPGKTGFAHLFEHLMFTGSEHLKGSGNQGAFFEKMEQIGATGINGRTDRDRTQFFENVPTNAIEFALWMESDRMGYLLGAIDQSRLDTQRGVVQNEKRQNDNEPYGLVWELITKGTTPPDHPYSWMTIGSMEDLNAASLDDVKSWFKTYYVPVNAVVVLAGDIEAQTALQLAERYFADIPGGQPISRCNRWVPRIEGARRQQYFDRVPQARIYKAWNVPPYGELDSAYLELVAEVLAGGKASRLHRKLVQQEQIAAEVSANIWLRELGGVLVIQATALPGGGLQDIEKTIDQELSRFRSNGPTKAELARGKAQTFSRFVRGAERVGGFGGKSDILALNETYRKKPDFYQIVLSQQHEASAANLQLAAKRWLADDVFILEVQPHPKGETSTRSIDRTKPPAIGPEIGVNFPTLQRATLSNGLKVVLIERHSSPVVEVKLQVDAGWAADQFAAPGTAQLTMDMLTEGTVSRTAAEISDELASLGAKLSTAADLDTCAVNLTALTNTLDPALKLFADVVRHPSFPKNDFKRVQKLRLASIQREESEPISLALRVLPTILYGPEHAYGNPLTGSGREPALERLTRIDLQRFHEQWFKPNHATLIIVGGRTLKAILPKLEQSFGSWNSGEVPTKKIQVNENHRQSGVYLLDRPGSIQSIIFAAQMFPPKANPDELALETLSSILGGNLTSRLNMNLRESKHWSYGASVFVVPAKGQRPFIAYAPVQADKTRESMVEMQKELRQIIADKPVTADELANAKSHQTLRLPGSWETSAAVAGAVADIVRFGFPDDYFITYPDKVRQLEMQTLNDAARQHLHPETFVWLVVGDRLALEPQIRELNWGEIRVLDSNGNLVK